MVRTCKRCGHAWRPRMDVPPVQCPRCRSPYWDKERVYGGTVRVGRSAVREGDVRVLRSDGSASGGVYSGAEKDGRDVLLPKRSSQGVQGNRTRQGSKATGVNHKAAGRRGRKTLETEVGKVPVVLEDGKGSERTHKEEPHVKWCPVSKCQHGYANSFVCHRAGGGC